MNLQHQPAVIQAAIKKLIAEANQVQYGSVGLVLIVHNGAITRIELLNKFYNDFDKTKIIPFSCDLTDEYAHQKLVNFTVEQFGSIDLLINNAGSTQTGDFLDLTENQWKNGFELKFYSTVRCSRAIWPHLIKSKGTIINIVGIGGRIGSEDFTIGGSVNSALINLTKSLADKGLNDGVNVNAVNPGFIKTERLNKRIQDYSKNNLISYDDSHVALLREYGIPRFGDPEEIASVVAFLASDMSSYCQGAIIDVDGGKNRVI